MYKGTKQSSFCTMFVHLTWMCMSNVSVNKIKKQKKDFTEMLNMFNSPLVN